MKSLTTYAELANMMPVKKKEYTVEDVVSLMKKRQGDTSMRSFAEVLGVTPAYICDIYKGRRTPGDAILRHFGLQVRREVRTFFVLDKVS